MTQAFKVRILLAFYELGEAMVKTTVENIAKHIGAQEEDVRKAVEEMIHTGTIVTFKDDCIMVVRGI